MEALYILAYIVADVQICRKEINVGGRFDPVCHFD